MDETNYGAGVAITEVKDTVNLKLTVEVHNPKDTPKKDPTVSIISPTVLYCIGKYHSIVSNGWNIATM